MAIFGKSNIIDAIRATKLVWWRIFEGPAQKAAGSFIATADFDNPNLGEKQSYDDLQAALNRLTAGRYILLAYKTATTKGGSAFESFIEVDSNGQSSIGATGAAPEFYLEGIGKVTSENFEEAINKKMQAMLDKQKKEQEEKALRDELAELKKQAKENDGIMNRGLIAIGTILYPQVSQLPAFKEVIGLVKDVTMAAGNGGQQQPAQHLGGHTPAPQQKQLPENHIEGDEAEIGGTKVNQDELFKTLDTLGENNPDVLDHLKILAKLKKDNPAMYNQAVEMAGTL